MINVAEKAEEPLTQEVFDYLAMRWKEEIQGMSNPNMMYNNVYYMRIVSFGWKAIPFILRDLEKEVSPWFSALRVITGENPTKKEHQGRFVLIAEDWLNWGAQEKII